MSYLNRFSERCNEQAGTRRIVFWGWNPLVIRKLLGGGLNSSCEVFSASRTAIERLSQEEPAFTFRHASEFHTLANDVFVVFHSNRLLEQSIESLRKWGFPDGSYSCLVPRGRIVLTHEDLNGGVFTDAFENRVENIPAGATVSLDGYGNRVIFGADIEMSGNLRVSMSGSENVVEIGGGCRFHGSFRIGIDGRGNGQTRIAIGENVSFKDFNAHFITPAELVIGRGTTFEPRVGISLTQNSLRFGKDCMVAADVSFIASDGHSIFDVKTGRSINSTLSSVDPERPFVRESSFGDHVWFGRRSIIIGPSTIGSGSIVGAGAVLKGQVPNNCTVAGNPARIVRRDIAWSRSRGEDISQVAEYAHLTADDE